MLPDEFGHVIIAGFGRVGQIIARLLTAKGVHIMALDANAHQVSLVKKFGHQSYFGDASRLDILRAAQTDKARAFVVAIGDVEVSVKTAALVRKHFPHVPIIARARNRQHAYRLMDVGVTIVHREAFLSSLELARETLRAVGISEPEARHAVDTFRTYDRRRLQEDYKHSSNRDKMEAREKEAQRELEQLLAHDRERLEAKESDEGQ
jgi:glutathione-regulated potassium-efflux system protein KefB